MFYSSTTLFHFTQTATPIAGSNRNVNFVFGALKTAGKVAWSGTKIATKIALKPFKYALGTRVAAKMGKAALKGVKSGLNAIETAEHTALEAGKGLFGMTGAPLLTWAGSSVHSVWIKLRYLSVSAVKCALKTPLAIISSPLNLARGVRDSVKNVFNHGIGVVKNIGSLDVKGVLSETRNLVKGALLPPITRPLVPCLAPAGNVISTAARSELIKLLAIKKSVDLAIAGGKRIANAYPTAKQKVAVINAEREFEAMKRKEAKEMEEQESMKKAQQVESKKINKAGK